MSTVTKLMTTSVANSLSPNRRIKWALVVQYVVLITLSIITLTPILVMFLTSLKTQVDIMSSDAMWFFVPTLDNYSHIIENNFMSYLGNSIIVGVGSTVLSLLVSGMAAYAARTKDMIANRAVHVLSPA